MATKVIESILEVCNVVSGYGVDYDSDTNTYEIDLDIYAPRDNTDHAELIKLQNRLRSEVNKAFRLKFILNYTI